MEDTVKLMLDYMQEHKITQLELSKVLGTNPPQVSRWVSCHHNPCRAWQYRINSLLANSNKEVGKLRRLKHAEK